MEIRQLRYFVHIVEAMSFGKAARVLRLAQPALTYQVRKLEDELGTQLLIRHSGGVLPTEAGTVFLEHARGVLRQLDQARQETIERSQIVSGKVTIGLPGPICLVFGAQIVRDLFASFPRVTFNIVESQSVRLEEWLLNGNLDLAVLYEGTGSKKLFHEEIAVEEVVLYGTPGDPRLPDRVTRIEHLAKFPLVMPSRPHTIRTLIDRVIAEHGVPISSVVELNSYAISMQLIADGRGYGLLPELCMEDQSSKGRFSICRLPQPLMSHRLFLSSPMDRPLTKAAREIARMLSPLIAGYYKATSMGHKRSLGQTPKKI